VTRLGVLVLAGPPCSGKSSVGRVLSAVLTGGRSVYIEVDALFSLLLPESDRNRRDRMLGYDTAHSVARTVFGAGLMPVLECTYSRLDQRASLGTAFEDIPALPLWVVEFHVSPEEAVQRFRRRYEPSDLDEHLVHERAETFPYSDQAFHVRSSTAVPHDVARQIAAWLAERPEPIPVDVWARAGKATDD
jgi:predicted kinase